MENRCRKEGENFQKLVDIMEKLRRECPWDREQTNQSIKNNLIEEAYELFEAIEKNDNEAILEELGDLLLQVVFHAQIKKDEGCFDINDVIENLIDKLIRRHPHVFGGVEYDSLEGEDHLKKWEAIKQKEKKRESILEGIPERMPALMRAVKVQKRMAKVGFDWEKAEEVIEKVEEELQELKEAKNKKEIKHEIGDLLIAVTNLARAYGIDPEEALHESIDRSIRRFQYIERKAKENNIDLKEMKLDDMEQYWQEAKSKGL
ncbi:tetrapyrrole methylase family protein / MazG family protein [Persephonella hydrogeniphila]|uniref:Nucleoside triphosphate pyrophosphohydrolase n=1 Tax=Persephonella hydrogeniphila TaxID=198703 RepID=A0A285NNR7_9AQUI|nr:nucleoside triphosphate pyrophosphohydrolase [Persephonella hydrogeniphila]SNZ11105.1 tetrapyrrole methylase family protein / MazG family protein [Persephonella hydrogeniphila]